MKAKKTKATVIGQCEAGNGGCVGPASCDGCMKCPVHCRCRRKPLVTYRGATYHCIWTGGTKTGGRKAKLMPATGGTAFVYAEVVWADAAEVRGLYADDGRGIPAKGGA